MSESASVALAWLVLVPWTAWADGPASHLGSTGPAKAEGAALYVYAQVRAGKKSLPHVSASWTQMRTDLRGRENWGPETPVGKMSPSCSNGDRSFRIDGLKPGRFRLTVAFVHGDRPERIAYETDLRQSLHGLVITPAGCWIDEKYYPPDKPEERNAKCAIRGKVVAPEGQPLPAKTAIQVSHYRPRSWGWIAAKLAPDGTFDCNVNWGRVRVFIRAPGFAKAMLGPFDTRPEQQLANIVGKLIPGHTGNVQFVSDGNARPGRGWVRVVFSGEHECERYPVGQFQIDEKGQIAIPHCPAAPLQLKVQAAGFENQTLEGVTVGSGRATELKLTPTAPASGTVVSAEDGKPIAGAEVRVLNVAQYLGHKDPSASLGGCWYRSGTDGLIALDTLRKRRPYWFLVAASGFAPEIIGPVWAGQEIGRIALAKELVLSGEIRFSGNAPAHCGIHLHQAIAFQYGMDMGQFNWNGVAGRPGAGADAGQTRSIPFRFFRFLGLKRGPLCLRAQMDLPSGMRGWFEYQTKLTQSVDRLFLTPSGSKLVPISQPEAVPATRPNR